MKLHSDILTVRDVEEALRRAKSRGNIDQFVQFDTFNVAGSRTRKNGYEIKLGWYGTKVKGDGRRYTNSGNRGGDTGHYAATWDEWGWFIAELFYADEHAVFGSYVGQDGFDKATRNKFADLPLFTE